MPTVSKEKSSAVHAFLALRTLTLYSFRFEVDVSRLDKERNDLETLKFAAAHGSVLSRVTAYGTRTCVSGNR